MARFDEVRRLHASAAQVWHAVRTVAGNATVLADLPPVLLVVKPRRSFEGHAYLLAAHPEGGTNLRHVVVTQTRAELEALLANYGSEAADASALVDALAERRAPLWRLALEGSLRALWHPVKLLVTPRDKTPYARPAKMRMDAIRMAVTNPQGEGRAPGRRR